MNFEDWKEMENAAIKVIDDFAASGIRVPVSHGEARTTLERVVYLKDRAQAMDAAHHDTDEVQPVSAIPEAGEEERPRQLSAKRVYRRAYALDARPHSDLDFYTRCAAESTRLA